MSSYSSFPTSLTEPIAPIAPRPTWIGLSRSVLVAIAAVFLVTVPVFFQAPLVRQWPWVSLALTGGWLGLSFWLSRSSRPLWGDLLTGFSWSWLAGSIYWGWFRWEPFLHLPIEAIALPLALWGLKRQWQPIGHRFYLGSLLGTAITDLYFYIVGLIPYWRDLMRSEKELQLQIFQSALHHMQTPWGLGWAIVLILSLLGIGLYSLRWQQLPGYAFGGAVLGTILVDGLFWLAAVAT